MDDVRLESGTQQRLADWLAGNPALRASDALRLVEGLAWRLHSLHQDGLLHRAVDTEHVIIDQVSEAQLTAPASPRLLGGEHCDPECCPPELAGTRAVELPAEIDAASAALRGHGIAMDPRRIDVYQLGALLCRLLSGEPVMAYLYSPTSCVKIPPPARAVLDAALGYDPSHRLGDCASVARALGEASSHVADDGDAQAAASTPIRPDAAGPHADTQALGAERASTPGPPRTSAPASAQISAGVFGGDLPFERLGHFRIVGRIGRGGMGDVYKGYDETLNRPVAVKVLPAELARDAEFVRRFRAEASAAAKIVHPNIVPVHFIGEDAGRHFFAMQFVDGESLEVELRRRARFPVEEALEIVEQCLAGLEAAHRRGLIHRDVKPGNILLERPSGRAVVVDFGLVRSTGVSTRLTATGVILGTVDYIAPEQARGQIVDRRADIYSLGVLLYELLAGRLPFEAGTPTAMIFKHAYEPPFPLEKAAPDVPEPVRGIVARMMAKPPDARYPSCSEALDDLRAFAEGRPLAAATVEAARDGLESGAISADEGGRPIDDVLLSERLARLASAGPITRLRDWAATVFRRHAPAMVHELRSTTQQVDAAVAVYVRRRKRLAKALAEARSLAAEMHEQEEANRRAAPDAAKRAAETEGEKAKWEALAQQATYEENAQSLGRQHDRQQQSIQEMDLELAKLDATVARLRSQREVLVARLRSAEARGARREEPRWRRRLATGALAAVVVILGGAFLLVRFPGRPQPGSEVRPAVPAVVRPAPASPQAPGVLSEGEASRRLVTNSIGMKLALVPEGEFTMGTPKPEIDALATTPEAFGVFDEEHGPNECPAHQVYISRPFYLGVCEVTQGQFVHVMGYNPSKCAAGPGDRSRYPVDNVDYHEAVKFCESLTALPAEKVAGRTYRLPTEAEWEYACRAGSQTHFAFGDKLDSAQANFLPHGQSSLAKTPGGHNVLRGTALVGSYRSNAFGLYDMHGNVW
jgi:formylglycine-generating enzyme required for sulfatase activity/predicted Ser/Thr protein kinase